MSKTTNEQIKAKHEKRRLERLSQPSANAKVEDILSLAADFKELYKFVIEATTETTLILDILFKKGFLTEEELIEQKAAFKKAIDEVAAKQQ